jgi:hypothetical protein
MSKIYAALFGLLFSIHAFAQPVLDQSYFPVVGKTFSGRSIYKTVPLPPIPEGVNQTWDFSGLDSVYITDYNFAFRVKTVANTDSGLYFPGAGSAFISYFGQDSIENFQRINGNDLEYMGNNVKGSPISERFSVPRVDFRSGLGFEETFIWQSRSTLNVGGFMKYNKYRDTITYAGSGTLITPFATYQNVILMKRFYSIDISFTAGGPFELGYLGRNWLWFIPGYGVPYVSYTEEVDYFVPDEKLIRGYVGFIPTVGNAPTLKNPLSFRLFPSMVESEKQIHLSGLQEDNGQQVEIRDALGRRVLETTVRNRSIQIPTFPSGIYSVLVKSSSGTGIQRLVVR